MTISSSDSLMGVDPALRRRIAAVLSGRAHLVDVHALPADSPLEQPIVVAVVDRVVWPDDDDLRDWFDLTPREAEIARILASERLSNPEIARQLGISVHTVRRHCEMILPKIGTDSRRAVRGILLDPRRSHSFRGPKQLP
jgi:DNA-binding CsgD family transcriptional regulator